MFAAIHHWENKYSDFVEVTAIEYFFACINLTIWALWFLPTGQSYCHLIPGYILVWCNDCVFYSGEWCRCVYTQMYQMCVCLCTCRRLARWNEVISLYLFFMYLFSCSSGGVYRWVGLLSVCISQQKDEKQWKYQLKCMSTVLCNCQ